MSTDEWYLQKISINHGSMTWCLNAQKPIRVTVDDFTASDDPKIHSMPLLSIESPISE